MDDSAEAFREALRGTDTATNNKKATTNAPAPMTTNRFCRKLCFTRRRVRVTGSPGTELDASPGPSTRDGAGMRNSPFSRVIAHYLQQGPQMGSGEEQDGPQIPPRLLVIAFAHSLV